MADSPPGSGIPIIGTVISALGQILQPFDQVQQLAANVERVAESEWTDLLSLAGWAFGLHAAELAFLGGMWDWLKKELTHLVLDVIWGHIKGILDAIRKWIDNLRNWIKVHVGILQQIQRNLDKARAQQMRLMIDVIQRIRKILVPFRLLHLGFAKKLDNYLVGLESDIGRKWATLIAHENLVLGVLNAIIDPRQLLRPGHTLGSLGVMIAAVHGAIGAADMRTLFCMGPTVAATPLVAPWSTTSALTLQQIRGRSGDYAVAVAQRDVALRQYALDLGTSSIV